jgi:hypothetical protein
MRKISIHVDSFDFKLSDVALFKLAEKKGITLYPERNDDEEFGYVLYWTVPQDQWKNCPDYNKDREGYIAGVEYEHAHDWDYIAHSLPRDDKDLISVIEELGSEVASGCHSTLHIVEIPDDVDWDLEHYDDEFGGEWVVEKHRSWHYDSRLPNVTEERPKR